MGFGAPPGVTKHTELTDKEAAGVIDHADDSVTDPKLASGVGLQDTQICKLPTAIADQILKRGALAWEVGDVPAPVLEGDYSSWAIYDTIVHAYGGFNYVIWNVDETKFLFWRGGVGNIFVYDVATKVVSDLGFRPYQADTTTEVSEIKSVLGKYAAFVDHDTLDHILVFKNGVLQQTITDADLGGRPWGYIETLTVSPTGKYIIVCLQLADLTEGWVVLVGS